MDSIAHPKNTLSLVVDGIAISQDDEGRYSLNDLQRAAVASGVTKDIRPSEWLAIDRTKELIDFLTQEKRGSYPVKATMGRYGGTYVCRELVYDYARWISVAFHVELIRGFDELVHGGRYSPKTPTPLDRKIFRIESIAMKLDKVQDPFSRALLISAADLAMSAVGLAMPDTKLLRPLQMPMNYEGDAA